MHEILVLVHVLSAIVGIGPTYASALLLRPGLSGGELQHNLRLSEKLSLFPKVGGTLAVLSGLALVFGGGYGPITQAWLLGSLALYVVIQALIVGFVAPREKQLAATFAGSPGAALGDPAREVLLRQIGGLHLVALLLGTVLFALMILKPR